MYFLFVFLEVDVGKNVVKNSHSSCFWYLIPKKVLVFDSLRIYTNQVTLIKR